MRKPRRLTPEELAPYQWEMPRASGGREPPVHFQPVPIDWPALVGNSNPVEIEVGMGKGLFLLNSAIDRPDTNFFGIEIVRKYQLYATTRYAIRRLPNVKTVCADARWVLRQFVPPESVATMHVYFPDPWWKARHKKRRVFTPDFAGDSARVLRARGRLSIATDVEEYFGVMAGIVRGMPVFRQLHAESSTSSVDEAGFATNFERKARQKGTPIWRAVFERTPGPISEVADPSGSA